jgi:hypothetical protein
LTLSLTRSLIPGRLNLREPETIAVAWDSGAAIPVCKLFTNLSSAVSTSGEPNDRSG